MIKELVRDESILSTKCEDATSADEQIALDLLDTMASLEDCSCLAANQIGETKRIFAFLDEKDRPRVMYNAKIVMGLNGERVGEGCLTRDGVSTVMRYAKVKVAYDELVDGSFVSRKKDYTGWVAQMIQHMVDHANGKLV